MRRMLKGVKIIDLTHRLPGPLAGKILQDLGAEVIKIEDEKHKDPFLTGMFSEFDRSFENWYEELNGKKKIVRLDFKSPEIKSEIAKYLDGAQGILLSLSPKLKDKLGLDDESLMGMNKALAVVELEASSTHNKAMHDLNALAISGYLSLHIEGKTDAVVNPPFLPVAGIAFGQQVATQMLANIINSRTSNRLVKTVSYLHDTAEQIFHPFWSKKLREEKKTSFLHNGAYPCYSLYRLKDGNYLAVAAVEDKFWEGLIEAFGINLPLERRFDRDEKAFDAVSREFAKWTTSEIEEKTKDKEYCLSIVRQIC